MRDSEAYFCYSEISSLIFILGVVMIAGCIEMGVGLLVII